jgi:Uma2 family endonuclease
MALLKDHEEVWMTGEELFRRPDLNPCELVNGRVVPTMPTGGEHADVELELGTRLRSYGKESKRGRAIGGEVGIYIRRDPDTVRAATSPSSPESAMSSRGRRDISRSLLSWS